MERKKPPKMWKMCLHKIKYNSLKDAEKNSIRLEEKYNCKYRVYYCPYCGKYHLTTNLTTNLK